jgi:uncharacterized protein YkwD
MRLKNKIQMSIESNNDFSYREVEVELFMIINSFRQEPSKLISLLESIIPRFKGRNYHPKSGEEGFITQEGVLVVYEAIEYLQKLKPLPPFKFSKGLYLAAKKHLKDMDEHGLASHKGSDGSNLSDRVDLFGQWRVLVAENIAFNDYLAEDILINFVLDDGNVNRGHRENLFNEKLGVIGIACGDHSTHGNCSVLNFAGQMEEYLDLGEDDLEYREIYALLDEFVGTEGINQMYLEDENESEEQGGEEDQNWSQNDESQQNEENMTPLNNIKKFESFKNKINNGKTDIMEKETPSKEDQMKIEKDLENILISPIQGSQEIKTKITFRR